MEYSVVIRTLGSGGLKYGALLESIKQQTIKPKEVIVVLPEGFQLPVEKLGFETFYFSKKGMLQQRLYGFEMTKTEYMLVCDDDVSFSDDFVERLYLQLQKQNADAIQPNNHDAFTDTSITERLKNVPYALMGHRFLSRKESVYARRISVTGGYIKNINLKAGKDYLSQSGNFQCFFIKTKVACSILFEDELWLEQVKYAIPDDQVFFYKLFINGYTIAYSPQITYNHLDGRTSINTNRDSLVTYAVAKNYVVFWHRFLFTQTNRFLLKGKLVAGLFYRCVNSTIIALAFCLIKGRKYKFKMTIKGIIDAFKFIKSQEYKQIRDPKI